MLKTAFVYIFGFFFIKFESIKTYIVRLCISGALCIFFLVGMIICFYEPELVTAIFCLIMCLLFLIRAITDGLRVGRNKSKQTNMLLEENNKNETQDNSPQA